MAMTGLDIVALVSSTVTISQALSRLFLPPEAIEPDVQMQYIAESGILQYSATFKLPKRKRAHSFRRKKMPCIELKCTEGFLLIKSHLDIDVVHKEIPIPSLHCCLPSIIGPENVETLAGREIELTLELNIDLGHKIHTPEPARLYAEDSHLKCNVTNTLDIPVKDYRFKIKVPDNRRLIEVLLIDNGSPKPIPVTLNRYAEVSCTTGKLLQDLPTINTADSSWVNDEHAYTSTEIVVPIDHIEANHELIVDLIFR